jgi:hypothetical protein
LGELTSALGRRYAVDNQNGSCASVDKVRFGEWPCRFGDRALHLIEMREKPLTGHRGNESRLLSGAKKLFDTDLCGVRRWAT